MCIYIYIYIYKNIYIYIYIYIHTYIYIYIYVFVCIIGLFVLYVLEECMCTGTLGFYAKADRPNSATRKLAHPQTLTTVVLTTHPNGTKDR